jgi:GT2 family glycosyltransferase/SAM-dependent methyltransferase
MPSASEPQISLKEVEVVVVTRNSAALIGPCVESIVASGGRPIVVDNGSSDDTLEIVDGKCHEAQIIATGDNLGYGRAMNLGFRETAGEFVILSNPDVVFLSGSIERMVSFLRGNPHVGLAGPQQRFPNGDWQRSYGDLPGLWAGIKDALGITTVHNAVRRAVWPQRIDRRPKDVPYVDGAVLAVRRKAFLEVGGFDEEFFLYSEEADLSTRLRKVGWEVVFLPTAEVIHVRGASSAKEDRSEQLARLMIKGQTLLAGKHLSAWKARIYAKLQVAHFARLGLTYRLLRWVGRDKSSTADKIGMFEAYKRTWKQFLRCPEWVHAAADPEPNDCKRPIGVNSAGSQNGKNIWDELWRRRKRLYIYRNVVRNAENCLGGLAGKAILEVGCGRGATLLELAKNGADVVGLDYSEEALAVCRALQKRDGIMGHAKFVNGDARRLPFPSESFDFVFSVGLIEHFQEPVTLLAEQYRVLRTGGFLMVQAPQKYSIYTALKGLLIGLGRWRYGGWETQFSDREISGLVGEAGLQPCSVYGYGSFFLAAARHAFLPSLDFGMMWRVGISSNMVRKVKARTALDICVVAKKISDNVCAQSPSTDLYEAVL